jgi:hypothetical protein
VADGCQVSQPARFGRGRSSETESQIDSVLCVVSCQSAGSLLKGKFFPSPLRRSGIAATPQGCQRLHFRPTLYDTLVLMCHRARGALICHTMWLIGDGNVPHSHLVPSVAHF